MSEKIGFFGQEWLCGAMAGMTTRLVIAPMDVLKIRLQVQDYAPARINARKYQNIINAIKTIFKEEGFPVCLSILK